MDVIAPFTVCQTLGDFFLVAREMFPSHVRTLPTQPPALGLLRRPALSRTLLLSLFDSRTHHENPARFELPAVR